MTDATPETWKPIADYEGLYLVSGPCRVRSLPRNTTSGRIMKLFPDRRGYLHVTLTKDGVQERRAVHQLVAEAFIGPCPDGMEVRHLDGVNTNNAAVNLKYGTHSENMFDKTAHGTSHTANATHCPQNHEYTPENTMINKAGSRVCLTCKRERGLEWYRANATRKNPDMICPVCEESFERPLGQGRRKYCSRECADEARAAKAREKRRVA